MIPRTIHYCWFGGAPYPPLVEDCMASWRRVLPGFELRRWDESNAATEIPFVAAALADGNWAFAADAARLDVLHRHGGIYLDTDMLVVADLEPYLAHRAFIGFESDRHLNAAILGAEPGHPFVAGLLDRYRAARYDRDSSEPIPEVVTGHLRDLGFTGEHGRHSFQGVEIFPTEHFYPFPWRESFREGADPLRHATDATATVHLWNMSWMSWARRPVSLYLSAGNYDGALKVLGARFRERPWQGPRFYRELAAAVAGRVRAGRTRRSSRA